MNRSSSLPHHVHRHISAARAFHTGLIADTHRRLRLLMNLAKHLDALRSDKTTLSEKVVAAETSQQHLETLEQLRRSSVETYRDLRKAMRRIHHHLRRLTSGRRVTRRGEIAIADDAALAEGRSSERTIPVRRNTPLTHSSGNAAQGLTDKWRARAEHE